MKEVLVMPKKLGEMIKAYRKEHKLTQAEFAKKIGKSQQIVAKYEGNINRPTAEDIPMIAKALDVPVHLVVAGIQNSLIGDNDDYHRFLVKLDSGTPIQELTQEYQIVVDDIEVTAEELKEALDSIRYKRFKDNTNPSNVIPNNKKN